MIRWLGCCLALGVLGTIQAQQSTSEQEARIGMERSRLETLRQESNQTLDRQEAACFEKFMVNDCLKDVKRRRLAMSSDIDRQETLLNDHQRQQRGAEQAQRTREKALAREESAKSDTLEKSAPQARALRLPAAMASEVRPAKEPNLPSADLRTAYERRQEEARTKRAERDKRVNDPGSKQLGLPVPD